MTLPAINLRARSSYSVMRSVTTAKKLPGMAAKADQPAMGLIDSRSLAGAYEFSTAARKEGVQPVIGCEFETADGSITLISENEKGWANLLSITRIQAQSAQRLVDIGDVLPRAEGLSMLAGGPGSALVHLLSRDKSEANAWLKQVMPVFGDALFLEISRADGRRSSEAVLDRISRAYGIPLVGTSPVAYKTKDDYELLELLYAIEQKRLIDDGALQRPESGQHFKSSDELRALFADAPELLDNAARLALRCTDGAAPSKRKPMLPHYPDAKGDEIGMMRSLAAAGLEERIAKLPQKLHQSYRDRLELEMDVIGGQGFSGYFLIVADFINWSKRNGIPVGPGRGSGAGSIVAWSLGITDLDPIRWGLLFERFINPDRVSLPDFDVDFCQSRRMETVEYVRAKYGEDKVTAIGTAGSWGGRSAFGDAARALGIPTGKARAAAEMLSHKFPYSLSETNPEAEGYIPPEVRERFREDASLERALVMGEPLQGFVRQHGRHAAGIIIADPDVGDVVPVMRDPGGGSDLVTQYDMKGVEDCGLVKFDFLGLKTTTIINEAVKHVRASDPALAGLDILEIPFEDDGIFDMLNKGDCYGIFQLESEGMVKALKQVRPTSFEDIVAIISLYRPGPMENIPAFANRKNGIEPVQVPHPKLKKLLEETQGIIVYQEQVMKAAQILSGYTLAEADLLRRAMGKKIPAEMAAQRERFVEGATKPLVNVNTKAGKRFSMKPETEIARADGGQARVTIEDANESGIEVVLGGLPSVIESIEPASTAKVNPERAGELFDLIDKFSGYGFNKSHAAAYALLTWQSSWLKLHHPAAFYSAALTYNDADFDKMRRLVREARDRGIEFLPPDLEHSDVAFTPELTEDGKPAVRWGLGSIKGVGVYAAPLAAACRGKDLKRIEDVAKLMAPHGNATGPIRALASAGAFDAFNKNRQAVAEHLSLCIREQDKQAKSQSLLFAIESPACPDVPDLPMDQKRAAEIEAIGISFHEHPLSNVWSEMRRLSAIQIAKVDEYAGCGAITVIVRVEGTSKSPRGTTTYAKISDTTAEIEVVTDTIMPVGELMVMEIARKGTEPRWRCVESKRFNRNAVPARLRVDIQASHDWEAIRKLIISRGRGDDRIDFMIDLGDKKARKILPACFVIDESLERELAARPDVISVKAM